MSMYKVCAWLHALAAGVVSGGCWGVGGTAGAQSPSFLGSDVPARSTDCSETPLGLPVSVHSTLAVSVLACAWHHAQLPGSLSPLAQVRC